MNRKLIPDEIPSGAIDKPDKRDFRAEHLFGSRFYTDLPESVDLLKTKAHNQGSTQHCTSYSVTHIHEILNTIEHSKKFTFDPEEQWENQLEDPGTAREEWGDYLISALKSLKKFGLTKDNENYPIKSYARIEKGDFKQYLAAGFPVYTGSNVTSTNFKKAKHEGVWGGDDGQKVGGHAFCIVGYDKEYYTALNSYGENWGYYDDGTFKIKKEDVDLLYSSYIIYDDKDLDYIFRDVTTESPMAEAIAWGLENGVYRGYGESDAPTERLFLPERPITRAEMAQMLYNYHHNVG